MIRTFSLWLILILSLLNMPAMAGSSVDDIQKVASSGSAQSTALQLLSSNYSNDLAYKQTDLAPLKRLSGKHISFVDLQSKVEAFSNDKQNAIYGAPDNVALRAVSTAEPEYSILAEFNPPDPAIKAIADFRFGKGDIPWYLSPTQRQRVKLSAWKDSNTLYCAKLKFYS